MKSNGVNKGKHEKKEVTISKKARKEDKNRNTQRIQMKIAAKNTTERPPERLLIHKLSNAGPKTIIDYNMKYATPCAPPSSRIIK